MTTERKRVRFSSAPSVEIESNCEADRIGERWLRASDFHAIMTESKLIAVESSRSGMAQILDGVFVAVKHSPQEVQDNLTLWSRYALSRRGLEAQISQRQSCHRRAIKECVWRTVLVAQDKLRSAKGSDDDKAEMIASLCSIQSLPAIQVAEMMGRSDFLASIDSHNALRPRGPMAPQLRRSPILQRDFAIER